jgi:hypothetical protein
VNLAAYPCSCSIFLLFVHAACTWVHGACLCLMSMLPVDQTCPSCMTMLLIYRWKDVTFLCKNNFKNVFRDSKKGRLATIFLFARLANSKSHYEIVLTTLATILRTFWFLKRVSLYTKVLKRDFSSTLGYAYPLLIHWLTFS